ncbi:ATP-binding protein [Amycolatopsis albispora]|uniref:ATP-binding protein n=1 Tax=Amycolatopsis albispora TaxID=1804986 RepID=UPI001F41396C|nr:ATP-binding protein [Amycolatopsis albispora]
MVDQDPGEHALDLSGDPAELVRVRRWARTVLAGLEPALLGDVVGALDELASNAIRHGSAPRRVLLRRSPELLRIEVSDSSPAPAAYRAPGNDGGRGLRMVDAYATSWGQAAHEGGKTVWAEVTLSPVDAVVLKTDVTGREVAGGEAVTPG